MKLWKNGLFYTMSNEGETVEAVLTNNGEIIGVGTEESLKEYYPEVLEEIDLAEVLYFQVLLIATCICFGMVKV